MKKVYFAIICVFSFFLCFAQETDSLQRTLLTAKEDTSKIDVLLKLSRQNIITGDYDVAMQYATEARKLSLQFNHKRHLATTYTYSGLVYFNWGDYAESLKNYFASLRIREELHDKKGIAATYHNIGNSYYSLKSSDEASEYFNQSLKIKRELNDTLDAHFAHTINNLGHFFHDRGNDDEALFYNNKALRIEQALDDLPGIVSSYNNLANVYINRKEYETALQFYKDALKIEEIVNDKEGIAAINISIGGLYFRKKEFNTAREFVMKGLDLAKQVGSKEDIKLAYGILSDIEHNSHNYEEALHYYKIYYDYSDSIRSEAIVKKSVQEQMYHEFSKKEALAKAEQEKKDMVNFEQSRQQRLIIYVVIFGLIIVLVFSLFLYNRFRLIRKQNQIIEK